MSSASVLTRYCLWARALPPLLCGGCLGGQTGGEVDGEPALGNDNQCDEVIRELGLDEPTPLGETAAQALDLVLGVNASPLLWSADTTPVTVGPERGESAIELSIEYQGARVVWVDSEPRGAGAGAGETALTALPVCPDRLEVAVIAHVATAGGALDERFPVTLQMSSLERASLVHALRFIELSGSLDVSAPAGKSAERVFVYAHWDAARFFGELRGEVTTERSVERMPSTSSNSASPESILFAAWPPPSGPNP